MNDYDCTADVLAHRERVAFWISWIADILEYRAKVHDQSKLEQPEKELFDEFTPKLKTIKFGDESSYGKAISEMMAVGLAHHYENNPHHPEHFKNGISGMSLWDLMEMVCDWMGAASIKDRNIDMDYLQKRFDISPQLRSIIENTLYSADMDVINNRIPLEFQPLTNFKGNE